MRWARILVGLILILPQPTQVWAQASEADFYKGKTVTLVTSTGPGGGYDLMARLIARHMPRHLPGNPNMVVQNMPGGGNIRAANYMYEVAPKD